MQANEAKTTLDGLTMHTKGKTHPVYKNILLVLLLLLPLSLFAAPVEQEQQAPAPAPAPESPENVETGSIRLGDLNLTTEEYVVQEGDWLIKVLREKGVPAERDVQKILMLLKELNSSFRDLNMIRPGEKIMILVKAGPSENSSSVAETRETDTAKKETPKTSPDLSKGKRGRLKFETYTMQPRDSIGALAVARYGLSRKELNTRYFALFRECNPSIHDLDRILIGQTVRLPVFPPVRIVESPKEASSIPDLDAASDGRIPIDPEKTGTRIPDPVVNAQKHSDRPPESAPSKPSKKKPAAAAAIPFTPSGIGHIFTEMGNDWMDSGEHFIPLKSGGQINLKASSYPVIRLNDGITVILDMRGELPQNMSRFIQSTWNDYRIVQLESGDDLRSALDKILKACGFVRAVKSGEPLLLGNEIPMEIRGDWILTVTDKVGDSKAEYLVLNLVSSPSGYVPETIQNHMENLKLHLIEYPPGVNPLDARKPLGKVYRAQDRFVLIELLLTLTGHAFSAREQIPAFLGQKEDFRLVINADFFVKTAAGNIVFDLTGLDPQIIALLKKRKISVLSLVKEQDPSVITERVLQTLNVKSGKGPHKLDAIQDAEGKKVTITIPGVIFKGADKKQVLVTPVDLPEDISAFLSRKDFAQILVSGPPFGGPSVEATK